MDQDQQYNNNPNVVLRKILANPANISGADAAVLQNLVNNYPQSGILQALLACTKGSKNFNQASVHFNTKSLYKLINYPSGFAKITNDKIVIEDALQHRNLPEEWFQDSSNKAVTAENENSHPEYYRYVDQDKKESLNGVSNDLHVEIIDEKQDQNLEKAPEAELPETSLEKTEEPEVHLPIIDGVQERDKTEQLNKPEEIVIAFANSEESIPVSLETKQVDIVLKAASGVTCYSDEAPPYSFLWWLNKTRKEDAGNYQPYAAPKPVLVISPNNKIEKVDELQHQYFENIFHVTSVETLEKSTANKTDVFDTTKKESQIIERFIKEEPQIKPQKMDKLSAENKAIKSSEDREELVTETLAAIYTQQMLYNKALNAYEKLILKFPEKSRYFADKIEELKKKTNL